ncbi:MAG: transposase, partial [Chloroflexi bacterium]
MLNYAKVADKPNMLRALTGLTKEAFEKLAQAFAQAYEEHLDELDRQREKPRQRRRGGGRKSAIPTIEDKLLFILVYFRLYPIQIVQGFLFGLSQP